MIDQPAQVAQAPLVVVVGATASGKSALAIDLARRFQGEIVSADSRQIYRGMNIGTATPTAVERELAPHHLINVVEPDEPFGLASYLDLAQEAIAAIRARGRLPILAGGTGQYVWALVEGWQVPRVPPDPILRSALERRAAEEGGARLHAELARLDPDAATAIHPNNARRIIRALELLAATGRPPSALRARRTETPPFLLLGLDLPRSELYPRIDRRVESMVAGGLIDEVRGLLGRGYDRALPSLSGIGYAQIVRYLAAELSLDAALARIKHATHRLARQQGTWFRADDPRIAWLSGAPSDRAGALVEQYCRWLRGDSRGDKPP